MAIHTALTTDSEIYGEYAWMDGEVSGSNVGGHAAGRVLDKGNIIATENIYPNTLKGNTPRYPDAFEKVGAYNRGNNNFFKSSIDVHIFPVRRLNKSGIMNYTGSPFFRGIGNNCSSHAISLFKSGGALGFIPTSLMTPTLGYHLLLAREYWLQYYGL